MSLNKRDPIEFLLNTMEHASHAENPLLDGYGDKRAAVLDAIRELRARAEAAEAEKEKLQKEVLSLKENAERWFFARRWFRMSSNYMDGQNYFAPSPEWMKHRGATIDDVIDAARATMPEVKNG